MPTTTKKPAKSNGAAIKGKQPQTKANGVEQDKEIKKLMGTVSLEDRLERFEALKGLNSKRNYVALTLSEIQKFNFGTNGSSTLSLKDETGHEFKTSNTTLITMLSTNLQQRLEEKKKELETEIVEFEF